ncbi:MAG: hypothetical protein AAF412_04895, partial [Pseudomonadota bacterium]
MNLDRSSNTPGGDRMLFGGIVFVFGFIAWQAFRYDAGDLAKGLLFVVMALGAAQVLRGLYQWKYADRSAFAAANEQRENLLIDVPLIDGNRQMLNAIEDAVVIL